MQNQQIQMLCIKETNPLKKSNREGGRGAGLPVERRGPLLGRAGALQVAWKRLFISASPSVWGCLLWIPFPGLCSRFTHLDFKFQIQIFIKRKSCVRLQIERTIPFNCATGIPTIHGCPAPLPCSPFLFCHSLTTLERAGYSIPFLFRLPLLEYKLPEGGILRSVRCSKEQMEPGTPVM